MKIKDTCDLETISEAISNIEYHCNKLKKELEELYNDLNSSIYTVVDREE